MLRLSRSEEEDVRWRDPEKEDEGSSDEVEEDLNEDVCIPDEEIIDGPKIYLPGSVRCSGGPLDFMTSDGLSTMSSSQEWNLDTVGETDGFKSGSVETDSEPDESTATVVASLTDKWEEEEAQVERRRNRRRKQSAEAALELDRQQRSSNHHR